MAFDAQCTVKRITFFIAPQNSFAWFFGAERFRPTGRFRGSFAKLLAGRGVFARHMSVQKQTAKRLSLLIKEAPYFVCLFTKASLRLHWLAYGRCRPKPQRSQIVLRNDRGSAHAIFRAETAFPPKAPFRSPREHKTERKRPFWAAPAIRRRFSGNSFAENLYNHLGATQKQGFCGEVLRIPPSEPHNAPLLGLRPAAQAPRLPSDHRRGRRPRRSA